MRNSEIKNNTYLSHFHHASMLQVGQIQSMQYQPDDDGPFYLSKDKRNKLKHNCEMQQMETKKYTCAQLIDKIKDKTNLPTVRGTLKDVQDQAIKIGIPIDFQRQKVREGWIRKAKGTIQILWERGWIDP